MSINMKGILICTNGHSNLERACTSLAFELLSQIKRSRSLLSTQTKWKIKRLTSFGLVENDSDLVHGLLEVLSHSLFLSTIHLIYLKLTLSSIGPLLVATIIYYTVLFHLNHFIVKLLSRSFIPPIWKDVTHKKSSVISLHIWLDFADILLIIFWIVHLYPNHYEPNT